MDRINEQHEDLIDLGSISSETKGLPVGDQEDFGLPQRAIGAGLSDD